MVREEERSAHPFGGLAHFTNLLRKGRSFMPITDAELRGKLLTVFHGLRHNADGWVPTSDINVSGTDASRAMIGAVCQQLADAGLITWKPLKGANEGLVIGMARITGHGADVVEGLAASTIAIIFPAPASTLHFTSEPRSGSQLEGIAPARIANWEHYGVDAIEADLKSNKGTSFVGGPPEAREQAWRWVCHKRDQQQPKPTEIFSLKPTVYGISFDLKAAYRRVHEWWRAPKQ
jgi:hypothetical protein